jgi:hypothetical protein
MEATIADMRAIVGDAEGFNVLERLTEKDRSWRLAAYAFARDSKRFEIDVCISRDERSKLGTPWVVFFRKTLVMALEARHRLGRPPRLRFDVDTSASQAIANAERRERDAAMFLAIVSPAYVQSRHCIAELSRFRMMEPDLAQIIKVLKEPLNSPSEDPLPDVSMVGGNRSG